MKKYKIGIIHTTPATIASLGRLVRERTEEVEIINLLDDSMLHHMRDGWHPEAVRERWLTYAKILAKTGVDIILSACSTVGEFAEEADRLPEVGVRVLRIDEAMAEKAVAEPAVMAGGRISVLATLSSTLAPTVRLLARKAQALGREADIRSLLVAGAYEALMRGEQAEHDRLIREIIEEARAESAVLVLAQASMASAIPPGFLSGIPILTSPESGVERLWEILERGLA